MSDDIDREFQRLLSEVDQSASQAKPSRESLREVKREAKERARQEEQRRQAAAAYWAAESGRPAKRRRGRRLVAALAVLGVAGAGAWWWFGQPQVNPDPSAAAATPVAKPSGKASAKATAKPSAAGTTVAQPTSAPADEPDVVPAFSGTPARSWSIGAKGIVLPKPTQVGIYRPAQVADAYTKTRRYLVAAMLDPAVLYRGKLAPVLDTMSAESQRWVQGEIAAAKRDAKTREVPNWTWIANRFRPDDWTAASEIRVNGKMRPAIDKKTGALQIDFTYIAAYWLKPRGGGDSRTVAVRRHGRAYSLADGSRRVGLMGHGGDGVTTSEAVCGAAWPYPQFLEVWENPTAAPVTAPSPVNGDWNLADPDAVGTAGCFHDTSGF